MDREALKKYIDDLRAADSRDNALFCRLFNRGVELLGVEDKDIAGRFDACLSG